MLRSAGVKLETLPTPSLPVALFYRDHLLPRSETFVRAQGEGLRRFTAHYAGSRILENGLSLPADRTLVINKGGRLGRLAEGAFKVFGVAPNFYRKARRLKPVLVHAHFGIDGALALPLAKFVSAPLVVTFYGYDATVTDEHARRSFYAHRRYIRKRQNLQREARLFIAISEFIRAKLLEQGFPPDRTIVNYLGVDLQRFRPDARNARELTVLFVGRLVEVKGCRHLLNAMVRVQQLLPAARLVIIGDGPLREELERVARGSLRQCDFLGARPQEEVRDWMNRARVFSVPSITAGSGACEGFGLVFAEAQAMGLPVASFANGGIPEAVASGESGLLVQPGDEAGLADAIVRLLSDDGQWTAFSEAGMTRVRQLFDVRTQARRLEEVYDQVLADKNIAGH